jgi:phosphatidate cytidylyltransferase
MADAEAPARKKSDLGTRAASAVVMAAVAGTALWLGGGFWLAFDVLVAIGVFWEWRSLVIGFVRSAAARGLWNAAGLIYLGVAAWALAFLRRNEWGTDILLVAIAAVIATDVGAYFAGRTIGGPKIAPKISPSKTWAGLGGGILGAALSLLLFALAMGSRGDTGLIPECLLGGALVAIIAQAGDFFESWMKRRAGVKDSGSLLPGHGGLFDRVDGLLAVMFLAGIAIAVSRAMEPL